MRFADIQPFVRYVHYIPVDSSSQYGETIPYDNRIFFADSGEGEIEAEGNTYSMTEGDMIIIPSGSKYRLLPSAGSVTYIAVNFDYTRINFEKKKPIPPAEASGYNCERLLENVNFSDAESFNSVVYIKGMNKFSGKFVKIEREYFHKLLYSENIVSGILSEMLFECARDLNEQKCSSNTKIAGVVVGYINENYGRQLSNREIAKVFNLHPNYVSNLIKISTGKPLHRYLLDTRVSRSVELLEEKKYSITQIAEKCGFCDIYHFSKAFKKIMGVSPSRYL